MSYQRASRPRTSKSEGKLEEGHRSSTARAKAARHDIDVGRATAELCIDDDEAYSPVRHDAEYDQQDEPDEEASLVDRVGEA